MLWQSDLGAAKKFPIYKERVSGQFRGEVFNVFNRSQYANPSSNFSSIASASTPAQLSSALASFSNTSSVVNTGATGGGTPRRIQFSLRF